MAKKNKPKKITYQELVKKKVPYILIPGILAALTLGWNAKPFQTQDSYYHIQEIFPHTGNVTIVQDGDTFELSTGHRIRLIGINAPDKGNPNFTKAKDQLSQLVQDQKVYLEYDRYQDDKYGRILAWVWIDCESDPTFLPADYMHKSNNQSNPGLNENPQGCTQGTLVNQELSTFPFNTFTTYKDRGELKYQKRIQTSISSE